MKNRRKHIPLKNKTKKMANSIEDLDTEVLLDILDGTNTATDWTPEDCGIELKARIVPENDPVEATRGFIRPRRPHL